MSYLIITCYLTFLNKLVFICGIVFYHIDTNNVFNHLFADMYIIHILDSFYSDFFSVLNLIL